MATCRDQNAAQHHNIKLRNTRTSFQWQEQFSYLETTVTGQNSIYEKLKADGIQGMIADILCFVFQFTMRKHKR
jgi:hypothetical protein